ncbi:DUF5722 domain-containing protein [Candidatus Laterigemmans baculatus]|uniref:DUF5722 domain-containing protein n=1 Tax=Candidatus Laterigemmans baculatus TaxID=2770505 RepID=UPI001F2206B8|nr:DUF5722 domain-containing protein [Candidatus Laterigemmans baculatus]
MRKYMVGFLALVLTLGTLPLAATADEARVPLSLEGAVTNYLEIEQRDQGQWELRTTGGDPFIEIPLPELAAAAQTPVLAFEYFSPQGVVGMEIRLAADKGWTPPIDIEGLRPAEGWSEAGLPLSVEGNRFWEEGKPRRLRIDFGIVEGVNLRVRQLALRPRSAEELRSEEEQAQERLQKQQHADQIAAYLEADFPGSISAVAVEATTIRIHGQCPERGQSPEGETRVALAELPWHADAVRPGPRHVVVRLGEENCDAEGRFEIELPREEAGRDRLGSRWQIVAATEVAEIFEPLSHACYATDLSRLGAPELPPPPRLENAKGLGGVSPVFGLEELNELGVRHITVNIVLSKLLSEFPSPGEEARDAAGGSGETFIHNGRTWRVNSRQLAHADRSIAFATEHGITVALILLLPTRDADILLHPEANRAGVYAMPNLDDPQAADKYEAVLALLAERYSGRPTASGGQRSVGRVDHWIIHNEVDYGWTWTNMGKQPLEVFLGTYVRSMRMTYLQARRFNPHAKVFISLTHRWNVPRDEQWKTYPPREMLRRLAQFTAAEGDFGWGIAYHPYPESLWDSRTWEDTQIQDDFDTPLITMKNIQVLDRFVKLPENRDAEGRVRPVLLSEQGYHTEEGYSEQTQREQAAALLYTWDRLRSIDTVLAYDYHRWVDAAGEGGLLLGLRKLGSRGKPAGGKKLGWEVYRAIGTSEEAKWRERLEEVYTFKPLFDGSSLSGWNGDPAWFRVEEQAIVAGSLEKPIPHNVFLCTDESFEDFELRLEVKLVGPGENAGVQFRTERIAGSHEVSGYQADMGSAGGRPVWGSLYDESRRRKMLVEADPEVVRDILRKDDWNRLRIRCEGPRIQIWLNDRQTVDYREADEAIARRGVIALQIHGGPPAEASYRNIRLKEL